LGQGHRPRNLYQDVRRQTTPWPGGLIDKGTNGKRARRVPLIEAELALLDVQIGFLPAEGVCRRWTGGACAMRSSEWPMRLRRCSPGSFSPALTRRRDDRARPGARRPRAVADLPTRRPRRPPSSGLPGRAASMTPHPLSARRSPGRASMPNRGCCTPLLYRCDRGHPRWWRRPLTCVGTAGFEPTTPCCGSGPFVISR